MAQQAKVKTVKLVHANGATVNVAAEKAETHIATGVFAATEGSEPEGYAAMKVDELKAEIAGRNDGRDEADLIADTGKKADLIAALEADDAASS